MKFYDKYDTRRDKIKLLTDVCQCSLKRCSCFGLALPTVNATAQAAGRRALGISEFDRKHAVFINDEAILNSCVIITFILSSPPGNSTEQLCKLQKNVYQFCFLRSLFRYAYTHKKKGKTISGRWSFFLMDCDPITLLNRTCPISTHFQSWDLMANSITAFFLRSRGSTRLPFRRAVIQAHMDWWEIPFIFPSLKKRKY